MNEAKDQEFIEQCEHLESFEKEPQTFTLGELMDHWENDAIEEWGYLGTENPPADTLLRFKLLGPNNHIMERQYDDGQWEIFLEDFVLEELKPEWIGG